MALGVNFCELCHSGVRSSDGGDVVTDLELKTPGSSVPSHSEVTNKVSIVFSFI